MKGQHFLVDGNLIDAIVRVADVGPKDCVLEIGTGTGILTDALADRAAAVVSCDIDARLQRLTMGLRDWPASVTFLAEDILQGKHQGPGIAVGHERSALLVTGVYELDVISTKSLSDHAVSGQAGKPENILHTLGAKQFNNGASRFHLCHFFT